MERLSEPRKKGELSQSVAQNLRKLASTLGPGAAMPTFREIMQRYDVSQATVSAALRQLSAEGVLETRPGKGIFVEGRSADLPTLLICETAAFVSASPFWELLLESITRIFSDHPDRLEIEFTAVNLERRSDIPTHRYVSKGLWAKLQANRFAGVIAICVDERLVMEIDRIGIPMVGFACATETAVTVDMWSLAKLGVAELMRLGCKKINVYNAPSVDIRELHRSILTVPGAADCVQPASRVFKVHEPQIGHRSRLFEHGVAEATRIFGPESDPGVRPDGIVSIDEKFTQGFILGLGKLGLQPGADVEIATHFNAGSYVLSPWLSQLICLENNATRLAVALKVGIESLQLGQVPNSGGWEDSVIQTGQRGKVRDLRLMPRLIPKGSA